MRFRQIGSEIGRRGLQDSEIISPSSASAADFLYEDIPELLKQRFKLTEQDYDKALRNYRVLSRD